MWVTRDVGGALVMIFSLCFPSVGLANWLMLVRLLLPCAMRLQIEAQQRPAPRISLLFRVQFTIML